MHPREFGKFRILKLLPLGGMGRVYLAVDTTTEEQVALKLIDHGPNPEQAEIVEAERRGAMLQANLCSLDNRVTVIRSFGDLDGFFFIEMEYVDGQDLSEILKEGPLGVPFAARIARDVCEVLRHAHTYTTEIEGHSYFGIVHGDIKPRNIRITPSGQVKVLDFGIAKALSLTRKFTTNHFGSSLYSSPERLNTGDVDVASDLWSVGVVMFEIVTGKPYFQNGSAHRLDQLIRNYREVQALPSELPARFRAILRKALDPDPQRRYLTASAFAADLDAFLQNRATVAETSPPPEANDATRRTVPSADDEQATIRVGQRKTVAEQPPVPRSRSLSMRARQVRAIASLAAGLLVMGFLVHQITIGKRGAALARQIETEQLTDLNAAWSQYKALASSAYVPFLLRRTANAMESRLTSTADRTLLDYRAEAPNIREADWAKARLSLNHALELDPDDKQVRGKMYLCEGHIARIRGDSRTALSKFEQARNLMSKSPDPYLGLARLYIYNLKDVERAEDALRKADKLGHDKGRREKAQLADGYKDRGDKLMREATRVVGLSEEEEYLKRAREDYRKAEDLYREIVPFANATTALRRILDQLDTISLRLETLKSGA
jgi:serine/threonine protein kinase